MGYSETYQVHNKWLYFGLIASVSLLVIIGLGPGLFADVQASPISWQYLFFNVLCHQETARSFTLNGIQMAVCARCIGIYGTFLVGLMVMPLISVLNFSFKAEKNWLISAIILNLADIIGNYLGFWTNTHISRLVLGSVFGLSLAIILSKEFFTLNKSE